LIIQPRAELTIIDDSDVEVSADIDWTAKGVISPVKNQGSCSASYAFASIGAVEGIAAITTKIQV
jgi:C1A family cysteine protease